MARLVFIGLSITSSWGNGHATTYRGLLKALARARSRASRSWSATCPGTPATATCRTRPSAAPSSTTTSTTWRRRAARRSADAVIVGSYVPEGVAVGRWALARAAGPVAFYDIDTPVTLAKLAAGDHGIPRRRAGGGLRALPLVHRRADAGPARGDGEPARGAALLLGRSRGAQAGGREAAVAARLSRHLLAATGSRLSRALLIEPARALAGRRVRRRRPAVSGRTSDWPANVDRIEHLPPAEHAAFYCSQDFTLNVTRADMRAAGYAPSVRLFEAAACGVPIISDDWPGLETVLVPGREILVAAGTEEARRILEETGPTSRDRLGAAAQRAVLSRHTVGHRAASAGEVMLEEAARASGRRPRHKRASPHRGDHGARSVVPQPPSSRRGPDRAAPPFRRLPALQVAGDRAAHAGRSLRQAGSRHRLQRRLLHRSRWPNGAPASSASTSTSTIWSRRAGRPKITGLSGRTEFRKGTVYDVGAPWRGFRHRRLHGRCSTTCAIRCWRWTASPLWTQR